ncbi:hypothetical protein SPFM8_00134 [Salmonella phage SPFM8]|nr:hypothetical protein SPFM8_00134 [Salmonella phage SPFM8]
MNNTSFARLYNYSGQFPRFDDIPVGTSYVGSGNTELYLDGEWFNTTKNGYEYVVRLPYLFDYKFWQDGNGYVPGWATARNQRRTVDNSIINASPQFIYNQGMMYGSSAVGAWHKFIYKNRILFMSVTPAELFTNTELNGLVVNMFTGPGPQKLLYGDWHAGYFGTAVKDGERVFNTPTAQGFFLDATSYEDNAVENNTTYRYWIAGNATIDVNAPGTPLATLPGDHFAQRKPQALDSIEIYRKTPGRYLDSSNRAYRGLIMPITLGFH